MDLLLTISYVRSSVSYIPNARLGSSRVKEEGKRIGMISTFMIRVEVVEAEAVGAEQWE